MSKVTGLNILKAAMDLKGVRNVCWESSTAMLTSNNLPTSFEFHGGVILITNVNVCGNGKVAKHLNAVVDRSYRIPVGDSSVEGRFDLIQYMVKRQRMLRTDEYPGMGDSTEDLLLAWLEERLTDLTTVSLRTVLKLADLHKHFPAKWETLAATSLAEG